jgi:NADH-quinone oxidoreductase subunit N
MLSFFEFNFIYQLISSSAEMTLTIGCFILFSWGLYYAVSPFHDNQKLLQAVLRGILITLLFAFGLLFQNGSFFAVTFAETLLISPDIVLCKGTLLLGAFVYFILFLKNTRSLELTQSNTDNNKTVIPMASNVPYEVPLLMILSLIGMIFLLSSYDLLMIYLSIELQSLCFYLLATFRTKSKFATEAGVKYFILGAFASGILLFGISLIYGFTGTTNFSTLQLIWLVDDTIPTSLRIGLLFFLIGFFFKIGLAPFHQWLPDVYEGSPLIVTFFFSLFPKLVYFGLLGRLLLTTFLPLYSFWQPLLQLITIITLIAGTLGTLYQKKIKRFLAYSTITHAGYLCLGLVVANLEGLHVVYLYLFSYLITIIGVFSLLLMCFYRTTGRPLRYLTELAFLRYHHPLLSFGLSMLILSMAGIPFLVGFFLKFALFTVVWSYKFYLEVFVAFIATIVGAFYYVRIVKIVLFEKTPASWSDVNTGPYICTGILAPSFWASVLSVILLGLIIESLFIGSWEMLNYTHMSMFFFMNKIQRLQITVRTFFDRVKPWLPTIIKILVLFAWVRNLQGHYLELGYYFIVLADSNASRYFSSSSRTKSRRKFAQEPATQEPTNSEEDLSVVPATPTVTDDIPNENSVTSIETKIQELSVGSSSDNNKLFSDEELIEKEIEEGGWGEVTDDSEETISNFKDSLIGLAGCKSDRAIKQDFFLNRLEGLPDGSKLDFSLNITERLGTIANLMAKVLVSDNVTAPKEFQERLEISVFNYRFLTFETDDLRPFPRRFQIWMQSPIMWNNDIGLYLALMVQLGRTIITLETHYDVIWYYIDCYHSPRVDTIDMIDDKTGEIIKSRPCLYTYTILMPNQLKILDQTRPILEQLKLLFSNSVMLLIYMGLMYSGSLGPEFEILKTFAEFALNTQTFPFTEFFNPTMTETFNQTINLITDLHADELRRTFFCFNYENYRNPVPDTWIDKWSWKFPLAAGFKGLISLGNGQTEKIYEILLGIITSKKL